MHIGIIGAGHAGMMAARRASELGACVTLYSDENVLPYFRPRVEAFAFGLTREEKLYMRPHPWYSDNGIELARRLNARRNVPVPVMTVTANYSNELRQRVRELGYQLVHKPVKPLKLRMALSQLTSTVLQPE